MQNIKVDFTKTVGKMKPMHGLNNGPLTGNLRWDARHLFREAGIPITRLHDCEYPFGSGEYVDIPCIFKNFDADEDDPASYNFALTDLYLQAIAESGTKILYRLGVSIEHNPIKRYVYPPKDYLKWARICEHIIRHYNDGWANGMRLGIEYWEIWTEPNGCNPDDPVMWGGTMRDFAEFYDVAATYLKACFPALKIGGPAFSSPATPPVYAFFNALRDAGRHPPMDFFSWHGYVNTVEKAKKRANDAAAVLREYGYPDAESVYDEWNYVRDWNDMNQATEVINSEKGMAFNAAMMAAMQSEKCDMMNFYAANWQFAGIWNSLFERDPEINNRNGGLRVLRAKKPFYPFLAFNALYRLGNQCELCSDDERLYGAAASDGERGCIMLSSFADTDAPPEEKEVRFELKGLEGKSVTVRITDSDRTAQKLVSVAASAFEVVMPPYSMLLITVE